ncbi:MAG: redoxin domain-containing protein [Candidatus Acidiferrales bacterium]
MLRTRQLIPPLTVHTPDGRTVRASDFKQKKNLLVAFLDAQCLQCEDFIRRLANHAPGLREREAAALVILLETPSAFLTDSLPTDLIVGSDVSGRAALAFLGPDVLSSRGLEQRGIFVTDRYGELFVQWIFRGHDLPGAAEILGWLDRIEIACDECGAPHWSADA